ncbi:hypothetical protein [Rhizobium johnstonii]|uniref:hypothetical protein n=1 Tax=Rhizobium johnstonii TaxID=3019933 RepID=UPI003F95B74D
MASFIEQAVLSIDDKASSKVRSLNKDINNLIRNAKRLNGLKFDVGGIKQAQSQVRSLAKSINGLPRSKTVNVNVNQTTRNRTVAGRVTPVAPPRTRTGSAGGLNLGGAGPFSGLVRIASATITATGAITIAQAGLTAGLQGQAAETRQEIIIADPSLRSLAKEVAASAIRQSERVSLTRATEISTDAIVSGLRGDVLKTVVPRLAQLEGQSKLIAPERSEELTGLTNKVLNLANATDDATKSVKLAEGVFRASIAAGESFNAATTIAALRTSGFANTLDPEGLVGLSLAIDSLGQRAGSSLQRLQKELFTPVSQAGAGAGIAKGAVRSLTEQGFRGEQGISKEQADFFRRDPAKFIQTVIRDNLVKRGVDVNDRVATEQALSRAGFAETSRRLISDALSSIDEANRARSLVGQINFGGTETAAADDLGAALKNLTAGFNTFASQALDPLFAAIAPNVNGVAHFLEGIGTSATKLDDLGLAAGAAVSAFAVFKGGQSIISAIFNPLNQSALALDGSAAALTRAAFALGGKGIASNVATGAGGAAAGATGGIALLARVGGVLAGITALLKSSSADNKYISMSTDERAKSRAEARAIYENYKPKPQADTYAMLAGQRAASGGNNPLTNAVDMATTLGNTSNAFQHVFDTGARQLSESGTTISTGITTAGMNVGETIGGAIVAAGATVASQIASAISNVVINVPRQQAVAAPNVGAVTPTE